MPDLVVTKFSTEGKANIMWNTLDERERIIVLDAYGIDTNFANSPLFDDCWGDCEVCIKSIINHHNPEIILHFEQMTKYLVEKYKKSVKK